MKGGRVTPSNLRAFFWLPACLFACIHVPMPDEEFAGHFPTVGGGPQLRALSHFGYLPASVLGCACVVAFE